MTAKKFSNALGNIGENYVDEAVTYTSKRKKNPWVKWVSIAACLSLIVMGSVLSFLFHSPERPQNGIVSYFVITAHAANGESTELGLEDSCLNSGPLQGNIFGVDMPMFNFSVRPSDLNNNESLYSRFDISISYNGKVVGDKDEHIIVGYLIPTPSSNEPWSYSISGWFTESTDIVITVTDRESREIVETITVNVRYVVDLREYELKITNLDTEYAEQ